MRSRNYHVYVLLKGQSCPFRQTTTPAKLWGCLGVILLLSSFETRQRFRSDRYVAPVPHGLVFWSKLSFFPVDARRSKNDTKYNLYPPYSFVVGGCWSCTESYFYDTTAEHSDICSSFAACNIWCVSRRSPKRGISVNTFLFYSIFC